MSQMVQRTCGENWRGGRGPAEAGRRRRHQSRLGGVIAWPGRPQPVALPPVAGSEAHPEAAGNAGAHPVAAPAPRDRLRPIERLPAPIRSRAGADAVAERSLDGLTWLWRLLGQTTAARDQWSDLLRLAVTSAETPVRAEALNAIGRFAAAAGDQAIARAFFQEALVAGRASQSADSVVRSLDGLVRVAISGGAFDLARTLQQEALLIQRRVGDDRDVARSLAILGWLLLESNGARVAETLHEESLSLRVAVGESLPLAYSLVHLGWLARLTGRQEAARSHLAEALQVVRRHEERWKIVALLALLGRPISDEGPVRRAIGLLTGAEGLDVTDGSPEPYALAADAAVAAHDCLTPSALAATWGGSPEGDAALVERTLQAAEAHRAPIGGGPNGADGPMPLTPRELEVAALVGRGFTNRRIAEALVIAERTAETHARNIREKLGLSTRAQIAAWAATHVRPEAPGH
jgi:non-specific serine/threonine protein kinase